VSNSGKDSTDLFLQIHGEPAFKMLPSLFCADVQTEEEEEEEAASASQVAAAASPAASMELRAVSEGAPDHVPKGTSNPEPRSSASVGMSLGQRFKYAAAHATKAKTAALGAHYQGNIQPEEGGGKSWAEEEEWRVGDVRQCAKVARQGAEVAPQSEVTEATINSAEAIPASPAPPPPHKISSRLPVRKGKAVTEEGLPNHRGSTRHHLRVSVHTELEAVTESLAEAIVESIDAKSMQDKVKPGFQLAPLTGKGADDGDNVVPSPVASVGGGRLGLPPPKTKEKAYSDENKMMKGTPNASYEVFGKFGGGGALNRVAGRTGGMGGEAKSVGDGALLPVEPASSPRTAFSKRGNDSGGAAGVMSMGGVGVTPPSKAIISNGERQALSVAGHGAGGDVSKCPFAAMLAQAGGEELLANGGGMQLGQDEKMMTTPASGLSQFPASNLGEDAVAMSQALRMGASTHSLGSRSSPQGSQYGGSSVGSNFRGADGSIRR